MNSIKVMIALILIFGVAFSTALPNTSVLAEDVSNSTVKFTDVGEGNWATKYIDRMNLRGVVTGYDGNIFKPNQGITQAEAVTMMIRFLGYSSVDEEFERLEIDEESTLFNYVNDVPRWAKGSVAVAYQLKLIDKESAAGFVHSKEASRAWIAKLLVDGVKKRGSLQDLTKLTPFSDDKDIPDWAFYAINEAVRAKITTGYADSTFQPQRTVTRAELTAFLYRAERYVANEFLENVVRGTVEQIQEDTVILSLEDDQLKRYSFSVNPTIYHEYDIISVENIQVGDKISSMIDRSGRISFLDVLEGPKRESSNLEGTVVVVDVTQKFISIADKQGSLHSYKFSDDFVVTYDNTNIEIGKLNLNDKVALEVKGNLVLNVNIIEPYQQKRLVEVISFNEEAKILTVRDHNDELAVYTLDQNIRIVDLKGNPELQSSIKSGFKISLQFQNDQLVGIEFAKYSINEASLGKIDRNAKTIEIEVNKEKQTFTYSNDVKVTIKGYTDATLTDFYTSDIISLRVEDDKVVEIEVLNRSRSSYVYELVDSAAKMIKVKSVQDYEQVQYLSYRDKLTPTRNGQNLNSVINISINDRIEVLSINGLIEQIEVATSDIGRILEINIKDQYIRIKNNSNQEVHYKVSELTGVTSNNLQVAIDKLSTGDLIRYYMINDKIIDIIKQ